ncbi:FAD-dependent oxidoreductase [Desulfotomaculum copahuensis]|uniref:FAD-dependent oxidoreductase n=1 Tax=Desulfotomaculum copahuensis TaxID=1838280 RepID=A0A1B7LID9_9FIRM|nr:FAD-dependent oxidoreductase [Desulfotomaculum copahuensis]OAT86086.1 FAD-dependent oxidoreductase [Desulfotomaculum copahuensis]
MPGVVVIGGGWAGCGAALTAVKAGAEEVTLLERTDMFLGTGLVGGIMRNNGRYTAAEEAIALGGGDLFQAADACARHKNIEFPGHKHATLYDVCKIEPMVRRVLDHYGVKYRLLTRVKDVIMDGGKILAVVTEDGEKIYGDVFVETTGSCGPQGNCSKYGNGCAMCMFRCPSFGPRVSIAAKAGADEFQGKKADGSIGAMSGSCKINKDSLAPDIVEQLNRDGVAVIPVPPELQKGEAALATKACQQYALPAFNNNIVLLDTGHAKLMSPFYPLEKLRKVPGFENARYEDPYAGGIGNSMRFMAVSRRDNALQVNKVANLFCGGEKAGLLVGHTEAIVTGSLAGHNAVRYAAGRELLQLPDSLAIGDIIAHSNEQMQTEEGIRRKYTFSGANYFARMVEYNLYTTDQRAIRQRVAAAGLEGVYEQKVV